jgi:hypothetical protein
MRRIMVWVAVVAAIVGVSACGVSAAASPGAPAPAPSAAPVATPTPATPALPPDWAFMEAVRGTPGLKVNNIENLQLLTFGNAACRLIGSPGITYDYGIGVLTRGFSVNPQVGEQQAALMATAVANAAQAHLCPNEQWATSEITLPPIPQAGADSVANASAPHAPAPAGAATTIPGDGTYEVGVDIEPGKYKTAGSAQDSSFSCYWARLKDDGEDIIDNSIQNGPQTVTLRAGELFETTRCGAWTRQ